MTQREKNKQVLATIKDGDYFNLTKPEGKNETWNNQNRFATYQKVCTRVQGDWELKELFYEYAHGEYPFTSTSYWNLPLFVENNDCIVEKITDPFKEGCADKKAFLKAKVEECISKHLKSWNNLCETAIQSQVKGDSKRVEELLVSLGNVLDDIRAYAVFKDKRKGLLEYKLSNLANNGRTTPITFLKDGQKVLRSILSMNPVERYFIVECEANNSNLWEKVPFDKVLPNEQLYPVDFGWVYPWDSVMRRSELESLARRIMYFTESWDKPLTWEEYAKTLTKADSNHKQEIKRDFERLKPYLESPKTCALFSKSWSEMVYGK